MYMNRNRRMHGCRHRFKRLIMSILVLSMLLTVTGCGGASQTAGSRLNTQNAVDKVLNQKTGDGDVESKSSAGATTETTITTEMQTTTETFSTPVGSTIVACDMVIFAFNSIAGKVMRR